MGIRFKWKRFTFQLGLFTYIQSLNELQTTVFFMFFVAANSTKSKTTSRASVSRFLPAHITYLGRRKFRARGFNCSIRGHMGWV